MTTTITILADGITPFTTPAALHDRYGRLWDAGIPVNIGVIPAVRGTTSLDADGKTPLPAIPNDKRHAVQPFRITENTALCNYLNAMRQQRLIEICMQGYHGTYDEFASEDDVLLGQKIEEGLADLRNAMPDAALETIIAPEKTVSTTALQLLTQYDCHLCTPVTPKGKNTPKKLANERKHYFYGSPIITESNLAETADKLSEQIAANSFLLVRFPAWMGTNNQSLLEAWDTAVDTLLQQDNIYIDTFMYID